MPKQNQTAYILAYITCKPTTAELGCGRSKRPRQGPTSSQLDFCSTPDNAACFNSQPRLPTFGGDSFPGRN